MLGFMSSEFLHVAEDKSVFCSLCGSLPFIILTRGKLKEEDKTSQLTVHCLQDRVEGTVELSRIIDLLMSFI